MGSVEVHTKTTSDEIIPDVIDKIARTRPQQTWITVPQSADLTAGWRDITFAELAQAVDGLSWWLTENIKLPDEPIVISYVGLQDERYPVVLAAVIKIGHKIMLPSPRNSLEGSLALLENVKCSNFLFGSGVEIAVETIKRNAHSLSTMQIPSFQDLVESGAKRGPFAGRHSIDMSEKCVVLHTSGSTGLPKPVFLANATLAMKSRFKGMHFPVGREGVFTTFLERTSMFSMLPFFHCMGVVGIARSILDEAPSVLPPAGKPISSELVLQILHQTKPAIAFLAPSIIEDLVNMPGGLEALWRAKSIFYGGAPLNRSAGERVLQKSTLFNIIGSTEAWGLPLLKPKDKDDWWYFEFAAQAGVVMEPEGDGTYEMVLKRGQDVTYQAVFHNYPELQEWRTKDLFLRHPSKPDLYQYAGRKDDIIVLSNGEKLNPIDFEKAIEFHPLIRGALVVGENRFQVGLVVEPAWEKLEQGMGKDALIEEIWPVIQEANDKLPSHGQVWKTKIVVTSKENPFPRAGKGSIVRRAANTLYSSEIDTVLLGGKYLAELGSLESDANLAEVQAYLRKVCQVIMANFKDDTTNDTDFFSLGTDSLQVLGLFNAVTYALSTRKHISFGVKDVYAHPSINDLSEHIHSQINNGSPASKSGPKNQESILSNLIEKYTRDLPSVLSQARSTKIPNQRTVLLTGSTGSLGHHLLQRLIEDQNVGRIYCLNRFADARRLQQRTFESMGTKPDFSCVTFLHADFAAHHFNISSSDYSEMMETVDTLIHNAWAVDFNKSIQSYEQTHISGVRRCIDFSLESRNNAQIVFVSSIAAVGDWFQGPNDGEAKEVPEVLAQGNSSPLAQGYGESKHVAEQILGIVGHKSGVRSTIIRAGQLAGPAEGTGIWNKHEWLPCIIATSKSMGIVPESLASHEVIDWVPIDLASRVILDLTWSRSIPSNSSSPVAVYHLINPHPSSWKDLLPTIEEHFNNSKLNLERVSFVKWVDELARIPLTSEEAQSKPAIKLLDFYRGLASKEQTLPRLATTHTAMDSQTLREMKPIDAHLMSKWLESWHF